jgi:hypothetical protein
MDCSSGRIEGGYSIREHCGGRSKARLVQRGTKAALSARWRGGPVMSHVAVLGKPHGHRRIGFFRLPKCLISSCGVGGTGKETAVVRETSESSTCSPERWRQIAGCSSYKEHVYSTLKKHYARTFIRLDLSGLSWSTIQMEKKWDQMSSSTK